MFHPDAKRMTELEATDEPRHGIAAPDGSVFDFLAPRA